MNYKRIFTFGCSLTDYYWPTWADVVAYQTKIPTFNAGKAGIGNVGISCRIVEYDQKFKFNDEDLILVMWTSWTREDRYRNGDWLAAGNVFNNHYYDSQFLKRHWSWENDVVKNASSMIMVNKSYHIGDNYFALDFIEDGSEFQSSLIDLYRNSLPTGPKFHPDENSFDKKCVDGHPDILNHVKFYNEHVATKFQFPLVEDNSVFHKWQRNIETLINSKQSLHQQQAFFTNYFKRYGPSLSIKKWC